MNRTTTGLDGVSSAQTERERERGREGETLALSLCKPVFLRLPGRAPPGSFPPRSTPSWTPREAAPRNPQGQPLLALLGWLGSRPWPALAPVVARAWNDDDARPLPARSRPASRYLSTWSCQEWVTLATCPFSNLLQETLIIKTS